MSSWFFLVFVCHAFLPSRAATVATLPSALSVSDSSLGASWVFSFQPVLPPDYRPPFHLEDGSWARRLSQSPELGAWALCFLSIFPDYAAAGSSLVLLLRSGS